MLKGKEGAEKLSIPSPGISGSALKIIAVVTMMIDHIGAALIEIGILRIYDPIRLQVILGTETGMIWYRADMIFRGIGRISFPIFCFLLVEGFVHTKNLKKYTIQMFLFAILSEIPFDLAFHHRPFYEGAQNVFFTLGIGLLVLYGLRRYQFHEVKRLFIAAAGCAAAFVLKTDYDIFGIFLIMVLYLLRERKALQSLTGGLMMIFETYAFYCSGVLAFIPIWYYNGTRGKLNPKYYFYWFYPVHLLFLYLLRTYIMKVR